MAKNFIMACRFVTSDFRAPSLDRSEIEVRQFGTVTASPPAIELMPRQMATSTSLAMK
jgi:hypothetical protein